MFIQIWSLGWCDKDVPDKLESAVRRVIGDAADLITHDLGTIDVCYGDRPTGRSTPGSVTIIVQQAPNEGPYTDGKRKQLGQRIVAVTKELLPHRGVVVAFQPLVTTQGTYVCEPIPDAHNYGKGAKKRSA